MELAQTEIDLLKITAKEMIDKLSLAENQKTAHLRQNAFTHILDGKEEIQIHVLVTRNQFDFLDDFQTEVMTNHGPLIDPERDQMF